MIEIGKNKIVPRLAGFPARAVIVDGVPQTKVVATAVRALTKEKLGAAFLAHRHKRLLVTLSDGDLLTLSPQGTRGAAITVKLSEVYAWRLRSIALAKQLESARQKKARLFAQRVARRIKAQERRLFSNA